MKLIIITGQTATGKTKLALDLAKKHDGELINCDSRQIYKHLDIVTGKDLDLIGKNKIWLNDIVDPKVYFSSFDYQQNAVVVIKNILKRKKTPIIIGGTYFYLYHLLYKVETENIPPNWKLRNELNDKPVEFLQNTLKTLNSQMYLSLNNSDKNNPQRLIRRIEIAQEQNKTKKSINVETHCNASLQKLNDKLNIKNINIKFIGLKYKNKTNLISAITKRVDSRLKNGAIKEVESLLIKGYTETDPGLKTIGYKQIINYLNKKITKDQMINQWITKETQYSKRQYTFMKKDINIQWKDV